MNRISFATVAIAIVLVVSGVPLRAQTVDGGEVRVGVMGGATKPVGDAAAYTQHDWSLGALLLFGAPESHLAFRVDGQWQRLAGEQPISGQLTTPCLNCNDGAPVGAQDYRVLDVTTNLVYTFAPDAETTFYVLGGGGVYNERQLDTPSGASASVTRFGINAGMGVRFRIFHVQPFVEARYHNIIGAHVFAAGGGTPETSKSFQFVPINVGFVF